MTTPANLSDQILALPAGAGAARSVGETFQPNLATGTGSFAVPIETEPGPNGIGPALSLRYSTHGGNGAAGLGWSLGLAHVERRTDHGIPRFDDDLDSFAIQGDELLPIGANRYRYRSEGRFARIVHAVGDGRDCWVITERDGTRVWYGLVPEHRVYEGGRISAWFPSKKADALGNFVEYRWARDPVTREVYLLDVVWAGCFRVTATWETRPDPVTSARTGFAVIHSRRLKQLDVEVRRTSNGAFFAYRRYALSYSVSALTGRSLLRQIQVVGIRPDSATHALPALTFDYLEPELAERRWRTVTGAPAGTLRDRTLTLLQAGSGLPDILETRTLGWFLRENLGGGQFAPPRQVSSPHGVTLADPATFLSDMDGDGFADVVVGGGRRTYRALASGGFAESFAAPVRPTVDLTDPSVRMGNFSGTGMPEALHRSPSGFTLFRTDGAGRWTSPVRLLEGPSVRFDDPHLFHADMTGDGLTDLVYVERTRVLVFSALGGGRFEAPRVMAGSPDFGITFDPKAVQFADLTGSGQADVVYVQAGRVQVATNLAGVGFGPLTDVGRVAQSSRGHVEATDLLGTGAKGLLFTDELGRGTWQFLELFPRGSTDLLVGIDNGLGGSTAITYGSSAGHWAADRATGKRWAAPLPAAQRVVDRIEIRDAVTGNRIGTDFRYHHGVWDPLDREFRGFAAAEQLEVEAPAGDPQPLPPVLTKRWFHTGLELDLTPEFSGTGEASLVDKVPPAPGAQRSLRGQLRREEVYTLDRATNPGLAHRTHRVTEVAHQVFPVERTPGTERWSFAALETRRRVFDTDRTNERRIVEKVTTYDLHRGRGYGLPLEIREKGTGRWGSYTSAHEVQQASSLERLTRTEYVGLDTPDVQLFAATYTPTYVVGKPSRVERFAVSGSTETLLSSERTFYDGADYEGLGYPGSGTSAAVTKGLVSAVLTLAWTDALLSNAFPSGSGASAAHSARGTYLVEGTSHYIRTKRLKYSATGMIVGSKEPNNTAASLFAYEANYGLFPVSATDPKNHPTTLTRGELPHQVVKLVDANDNETEFTWDPLGLPASKSVKGKLVSSAWQGDPTTHPTEVYSYDFTSVPAHITIQTRQVREGATFDVHRYVDGFGRVTQERHTAEPDPATPTTPRFRVTGGQVYNHKGLVVRAYQPTFSGSSSYAAAPTNVPSIITTYDALGRPVRVDHPDGTYETTDYHPWVRTAYDRNDNAGAIPTSNARYGAHLHTLRDHLATPTRVYFDAFGREIAVSEDNGAGTLPTLRVTTYELTAGAFTGTTLSLTLDQDLAANYFVLIQGSAAVSSAANDGVRVATDPWGTGDLGSSGANNVIGLQRGSSSLGDWLGTITVVECLGDTGASGFRLRDVKLLSFASTSSGTEQTASATSSAWDSLGQVALYAGHGNGGAETSDATATWQALFAKVTPSGTTSIDAARWRISGTLAAADVLVYVVEWGTEHTIQRITVTGNAGGDALDASSEWNTAAINAVESARSWLTTNGYTKTSGIGGSYMAVVAALGDGTAPVPDVAASVAVGGESADDRVIAVTIHTHPSLVVHHVRKADGDASASTLTHAVSPAGETETYDETGSQRSTRGDRIPVQHASNNGSGTTGAMTTWRRRHTAAGSLRVSRAATGDAWVAAVQSVDCVGIRRPDTDSAELHVTRSVLDHKDQVLEVWDARGLSDATWKFAYDLAGRRTKVEHTTGTGTRWALADAAGNPIWSRDARAVEVDRTFDALNRPLEESSTQSATTKLRRKWNYIDYNSSDSASKSANLFGRVEEERDNAGLRFFEYDWRGLMKKTSHRFFDADWNNASWAKYADVDDDAIPSGARSGLTYLSLASLTDTTTVAITTTHDAAGRPTEVTYPEAMKLRSTWNPAGLLASVECDRGLGGGYGNVMSAATYNARGQLTGYTAGNGLLCYREYDVDTERITRIFTLAAGATGTRFQDQQFAYDPTGNPVLITDALATTQYASNQVIPNTRTFRYDPRYRLVRATGKRHKDATDGVDAPVTPSPSRADYLPYTHRYSYDAVGNFTTNQEYKSGTNNLDYKSGAPDLFDGFGSESYSYDANGCCTATPRHSAIGYSFDAQPVYVNMGGGTKVRYRRMADQRAVRCLTKSGVTALGIYIGPWEYHARTGGTAYRKIILHVDAPGRCGQAERVVNGSDPSSLTLFFVHADHLGSAQILTKSDGTLLCQEEFFAYGRSSDRRDARNRYRYIGVERDEETGLCMTGPRNYDPVVGRFHQPDPLGPPAWSPFVYSKSTPTARIDPSGWEDVPIEPEAPAPEASTPANTVHTPAPEKIISLKPSEWSPEDLAAFLPMARDVQRKLSRTEMKNLRKGGVEAGNWRQVETGHSAAYGADFTLKETSGLRTGSTSTSAAQASVEGKAVLGAGVGSSVRQSASIEFPNPTIPTPRLFVAAHAHSDAGVPSAPDLDAFIETPEQAQVEFILDERTEAALDLDKRISGYILVRDAAPDAGDYNPFGDIARTTVISDASNAAHFMQAMSGSVRMYQFSSKGGHFTSFVEIPLR